jgi:hypothetical protein
MARDDDDSGGFTGKRKKTFRELDAQRGKSKYHSRQDDPAQQRLEKSASYQKYKSAVDGLFSGAADVPAGMANAIDPEGKRKEMKAAMQRVGDAPDRKAWAERAIEFLEKYPQPEDPFFLDSLLDHPKDRVVDQALGRLELMVEEGRLTREKPPRSLEQRLRTLEMTNLDAEVQQRAKTLRGKLF